LLDTLIFYEFIYDTMNTSILIEEAESIQLAKSCPDEDLVYSLVDKPYYVDSIRYKVDS